MVCTRPYDAVVFGTAFRLLGGLGLIVQLIRLSAVETAFPDGLELPRQLLATAIQSRETTRCSTCPDAEWLRPVMA